MNFVLSLLLLLNAFDLFAKSLAMDFSCIAKTNQGTEIEVRIQDIDFAKELSLVGGDKICPLPMTHAEYRERAQSPMMLIDFSSKPNCDVVKTMKVLPEGFLKVDLDRSEAHVLILYDHQPLNCVIKSFHKMKLRDRIKLSP